MILHFPFGGIHKGGLPSGQPSDTSPDMQNVRPFYQGRLRGGQRPGLAKWGAGTQIGDVQQPIVAMCSVSYIESP
jgi:hypothetical protein